MDATMAIARGIALVAVFALGGVTVPPSAGQDAIRRNKIVRNIENTDQDFRALGPLYRELFEGVDSIGLAQMRSRHGDSIAIQAAWEELQRLEHRTRTTSDPITTRPEMANWFVGYFEGRGRVACPKSWRDYIVGSNSEAMSQASPGNGLVESPATKFVPPYEGVGLDPIEGPAGTRLRRRSKALELTIGDRTVQVPDELFATNKDGSLGRCCVSGKFTDSHVFVAVHSDTGDAHHVYCIDRMSQRVRWKAKACGCWWSGTSGIQQSRVTVTADGNRVFVFGWAAMGVYAHAFHIDTGRTSFCFSSTF